MINAVKKIFCYLILFFAGVETAHAQVSNSQGELRVKVRRTIGYIEDADGSNGADSPEYRHQFGFNTFESSSIYEFRSGDVQTWKFADHTLYEGIYTRRPDPFNIYFKAFEYDYGRGASNDDAIMGPLTFRITPLRYPAGKRNKVYLMMYMFDCNIYQDYFDNITDYQNKVSYLFANGGCNGVNYYIWGAELEVYYTTPKPTFSLTQPEEANACFEDDISTVVTLPEEFNRDISFSYQYRFDNEFFWRTLPQSSYTVDNRLSTDSKEIVAIHIGSIPRIADYIKPDDKLKITLGARATADNSTTSSDEDFVEVSAAAPTFAIAYVRPSCQDDSKASGEIRITNVQGLGNYRYFVQETSCPDPFEPSCGAIEVKTGTFSGSSHIIRGIRQSKGANFYIYVGNLGGALGNCASYKLAEVPAIPSPQWQSPALTDVSCPEGADGAVRFSVTSGKDGAFTYTLTPNSGSFVPGSTSRQGEFVNMPAGQYILSATDGCNETASQTITIEQPARPTATADDLPATCFNEPNGILALEAGYDTDYGNYVKAGSGFFNYRVLDADGVLVDEINTTDATSFAFSGLPGGTYTLMVEDVQQVECTPYEQTVVVQGAQPLALTVENVAHVSCYGEENGALTLSGAGGHGTYVFTAREVNSGTAYTAKNGELTGLQPGDYEILIENDLEGCTDRYQQPGLVTITQPDEILLDITPTNITCFEDDNGRLEVSTTGLLSAYTYEWRFNGATLKTGDQTEPLSLTDLQPGSYELRVTNTNGCPKTSETFVLAEPERLVVNAIAIDRPSCFGEIDGKIVTQVTGGWGVYQYYYSNDDQATWNRYALDQDFGPATYWIKVVDLEGCETIYSDPIAFLAPDNPLQLSMSLTSRNGYGVSCFEGNDGEVNLEANGGIAFASDTPYLYAVDDRDFGTDPLIIGLTAGVHTFHVKDANGCVQSEEMTLIEPTALELTLEAKADVRCFGDSTGFISVNALGGVEAYTYNLDGGTFGNAPRFDRISSGVYEVGVKDANTCETYLPVEIIDTHPPIGIAPEVTDVSCFDYADGQVSVAVDGGSAPYTYAWSNGATASDISGLDIGDYSLTVTDSEGCQASKAVEIAQPDNIDTPKEATLCQGQQFTIDATYPVEAAHYFWSADNGFTSNDAEITIADAGTYTAEVILPDGCVMSEPFELKRSDVQFEVNFLAATEIEVGDTLIIVDVTHPKPDSLHWQFGGDMDVIDTLAGYPQLTYDLPGEYEINVAAYHGGCVDHQTKYISVYEKGQKPDNGRIYFGEIGFKEFNAYPNPTRGPLEVQVQLHQSADVMLEIYDTFGFRVASQALTDTDFYLTTFDLTDHQSGVYLLRAVSGDEEKVIRVVLNK